MSTTVYDMLTLKTLLASGEVAAVYAISGEAGYGWPDYAWHVGCALRSTAIQRFFESGAGVRAVSALPRIWRRKPCTTCGYWVSNDRADYL